MAGITGYCTIDQRGLHRNGALLYANSGLPVSTLLSNAYQALAISYPRFVKMDTLCQLAFLAAEVIVQQRPKDTGCSEFDTGVILSNCNASMNTDKKYMDTLQAIPSPALFVCTLPNVAAAEICIRNKFKGEQNFFITPDFDATFLYHYVTALFTAGKLKQALCGWVEVLDEEFKAFLVMADTAALGRYPFTADHLQQFYNT